VDMRNHREIQIKYFALDELLGLLGGFFAIIVSVTSIIMSPISLIEFVINNSSKKEEI